MINRLTLRNWRAFEALDVEFTAGTTFIVAPNGVGKTSIVLAIAWGLFGEASGIDASHCVRAGADRAEVSVVLTLSDGRSMVIERSRGVKGRASSNYSLDGIAISAGEGEAALENDFGVSLDVAARLCMMRGGGAEGGDVLDLRDHLYRAFGVADLLNAAAIADRQLAAVRKERTSSMSSMKEATGDRARVELELAEVERGEAEIEERRNEVQKTLRQLEQHRLAEREWLSYEQRTAERTAVIASLVVEASSLGLAQESFGLDGLLQIARRLEEEIGVAELRRIDAAGRSAAAGHALDLLAGDHSVRVCPTCLRPFDGDDLADARSQHEASGSTASEEIANAASEVDRLRALLLQVDLIRARLTALPPAPSPPLPQASALSTTDDEAREGLLELTRSLGELRERRRRLTEEIAALDHAASQRAILNDVFRREALAEVAARSLEESAAILTEQRIDPLAEQVRLRWHELFGEDGLTLRPDGSIVRVVGDRVLPWESLSGGERIWARLVTHLLVLSASTRLPFAWFDEPLEHLDPRMRRAVASSLTSATSAGSPVQLLVTTYEHAIARELSAAWEHSTIRYIRSRDVLNLVN
jgi:DNA repair exonuclease SbcCD ATPase subunit